jgi:hypothetical protein
MAIKSAMLWLSSWSGGEKDALAFSPKTLPTQNPKQAK